MSEATNYCCLCGLGCAITPTLAALCPRRQSWLSSSRSLSSNDDRPWRTDIGPIAELLQPERRALIWLEAVDVNTTRAAVALAQASGATLHVGESTGSELTQRVLTSEGWLGTSLAEVASRADLVVTLGDGILSEAPLLVERFLQPALDADRAQWLHITSHASSTLGSTSQVIPQGSLHLPRGEWYDLLTALLIELQTNAGGISASPDLQALCAALLQSKNIVWLWDADEFCDAIDELTIRRLLGICRVLSTRARCALLCLDANVGRVTAHETLLWLTGCGSTTSYDPQRRCWQRPAGVANFSLHDWQARFDSILLIESVPALKPLPDITAAHYLLPACRTAARTMAGSAIDPQRRTTIATVGVQSAGHLFRGDRATTMLCQVEPSSTRENSPPTAAEVLDAVRAQLNQEVSAAF